MDNKEIQLRNEISEKVKEYYQHKFGVKDDFVPEQSKINYAGRVFDQNELMSNYHKLIALHII